MGQIRAGCDHDGWGPLERGERQGLQRSAPRPPVKRGPLPNEDDAMTGMGCKLRRESASTVCALRQVIRERAAGVCGGFCCGTRPQAARAVQIQSVEQQWYWQRRMRGNGPGDASQGSLRAPMT